MKQRLTLLLLVLMAIMPVAVAFAHYSEFAGQLSASQIVAAAETSDSGNSISPHSDHCQPAKAHLASCSFHVCVDCAITSAFGFIPPHISSHYSAGEIPLSVSLLVPPDIKPPIITL